MITIVKFVLVNILIPLICWCGDEGEKESPGLVDNAGERIYISTLHNEESKYSIILSWEIFKLRVGAV